MDKELINVLKVTILLIGTVAGFILFGGLYLFGPGIWLEKFDLPYIAILFTFSWLIFVNTLLWLLFGLCVPFDKVLYFIGALYLILILLDFAGVTFKIV